jgi:hypothetical protein
MRPVGLPAKACPYAGQERAYDRVALSDEVRAILIAQREMLGEEGAAHMRAWMKQLGCTDIPP